MGFYQAVKKDLSSGIFLHAALFVTSFLFVTVFSYSTSFCYDLLGGDSSLFQAVGKFWAQGHLPYVELFEHKGPLLFLIDAIGYAIYPRSGIMVLQIIFLYVSCLFIWRAMSLYSSNTRWKSLLLVFALIFFAAHYEEGNHVEEYTVIFLSAATYCFLRSLKENNFRPLYGFVYGLGFGACMMIRISDAAPLCCQIFLVTIFLLQARDFKNLWKNFLSFVAGFAAIVLPFVIYFAAHGALYDMFYGTILFNMKYTAVTFHLSRIIQAIYSLVHFMPLIVMIIVAAFALKQDNASRLFWSGIFIGTMLWIMLISFRPFGHYAMIIFPVMPILFAILQDSSDTLNGILKAPLSIERLLIKFLIVLMVIHTCVLVVHLKEYYLGEKNSMLVLFFKYEKRLAMTNPNEHQEILSLKQMIPPDEQASFVSWGDYCTTPHWVIYTDMKPREREFFNNSYHGFVDPAIRKEWFDNVRNDPPLWILYGTSPDRKPGEPPKTVAEDAELEQLLAEKYSLRGEVYVYPQMLKLYRLKE